MHDCSLSFFYYMKIFNILISFLKFIVIIIGYYHLTQIYI
jgi:hypothetical protein